MRHPHRWCLYLVALTLAACGKPAISDQTQHTTFVEPTPGPIVQVVPDWVFVARQQGYDELSVLTKEELHARVEEARRQLNQAATPTPTPILSRPAIVLPPPPDLTPAGTALLLSNGGRALVLEFETGGRSGYDPHPEWPQGASGVTIGIGYDLGYFSKSVIESDWQALQKNPRTRLLSVAGLSGTRARNVLPTVRDIFVAWDIATDVFDRVDVAREFASAKRAIPGFADLRPNAQAAWLSLGFNRGWQMSGPNRVEMRAARDLVPRRDYEGMANEFKKMKHVWAGTKIQAGMYRRRDAEAKLLLTP